MKQVTDEQKLKVIHFINEIENSFKHSKNYFKDIVALKKKYIYMAIGPNEYNRDVEYLKELKSIIDKWKL